MAQQAQETGMFGPMPYAVEEQIRQQRRAEAMQMAQMNPNQVGRYLSASVGDRLGDGVAALTGKEDPRMAQAKELQAIQKRVTDSGINPNDFEAFYSKLGEELARAGKLKEAANVAKAVQAFKADKADTETKQYQAETARIRVNAARLGKLDNPYTMKVLEKLDDFDPSTIEAYMKSQTTENPAGNFALLKPNPKSLKGSKPTKVGTTPEGFPIYMNEREEQFIMTPNGKTPYAGPEKPKDPLVTVNTGDVNAPGLSKQALDAMGAPFSKGAEAYNKKLDAALDMEGPLTSMRELASGMSKDGKPVTKITTSAMPAVDSFVRRWIREVKGGDDKTLDANDMFESFYVETIMPKLQAFGGNDSEQELKFAAKSMADRKMSPAVILRLISFVEQKTEKIKGIREKYREGIAAGKDPLRDDFSWQDGSWGKGTAPVQQTGKQQVPQSQVNRPPSAGTTPGQNLISKPPPSFYEKARKLKPGITDEEIQRRWDAS